MDLHDTIDWLNPPCMPPEIKRTLAEWERALWPPPEPGTHYGVVGPSRPPAIVDFTEAQNVYYEAMLRHRCAAGEHAAFQRGYAQAVEDVHRATRIG